MTKSLTTDERLTRIELALAELESHTGAAGGDQARANHPNLAAIIDERRASSK